MPATFVSVMFLILDTGSVMTLTYYRLKLLTTKQTVKNIFDKIDIVNERLNSYRKERIICYSYVCIVKFTRGAQTYMLFWITESNSLHPDFGAEFDSVCETLMLSLIHISASSEGLQVTT